MEWIIAAFLKFLVLFLLAIGILYPARIGVMKYVKPGKFKNFLLSRDPTLMTLGVVLAYVMLLAIAS